MTRKFTPGPWTYEALDNGIWIVKSVANPNYRLGQIYREGYGVSEDGNAALIAAAPIMLDFIKSYAAHENNVSRVGALALIKSITGV